MRLPIAIPHRFRVVCLIMHFACRMSHGSAIVTDYNDLHSSPAADASPSLLEYSTTIYDDLVRYAYIAKAAYCITKLKPQGSDLSEPIVLSPQKHNFFQNGLGGEVLPLSDLLSAEIYFAKYLYADSVLQQSDNRKGDEPVGFLAVDHNNGGRVILSLKGTTSTRDLVTDIEIGTTTYQPFNEDAKEIYDTWGCEGCKVQKGIYQRLEKMQEETISSLSKLIDTFPDYQLVITGHSIGGSIATLIGLEFALMDYHPLVITYGSPKVANAELAELIDASFATSEVLRDATAGLDLTEGLVRVIHTGDYAPLLPPSTTFVPAGIEFEIETVDLPQSIESVHLNGVASETSHKANFHILELLSFSFKKIVHLQEHSQYFWDVSTCDDIYNS